LSITRGASPNRKGLLAVNAVCGLKLLASHQSFLGGRLGLEVVQDRRRVCISAQKCEKVAGSGHEMSRLSGSRDTCRTTQRGGYGLDESYC
jgi:hypothetical protein